MMPCVATTKDDSEGVFLTGLNPGYLIPKFLPSLNLNRMGGFSDRRLAFLIRHFPYTAAEYH